MASVRISNRLEDALNVLSEESSDILDMIDLRRSEGSVKYYRSKLKIVKEELENMLTMLEWGFEDAEHVYHGYKDKDSDLDSEDEESDDEDDDSGG